MIINIKFLVLLVFLTIWEMTWKGIGLWRAGKNDHLLWFIAILVFNTIGILPIVYLLLDRRKKGRGEVPKKKVQVKKKVVKKKSKK